MAIWLIRAGSHGEYEQKFLQEKRVYVTWDELNVDISQLKNREALFEEMVERYGAETPNRLHNWVRQIWPFAHEIKKGDWVVLPLKSQPAIYIGEVTGAYHFEPAGPDPFFHWLPVKWIGEAIPRNIFNEDLLYSFGAFLTICRIRRNNAEDRIKAMKASNWGPDPLLGQKPAEPEDSQTDEIIPRSDLEQQGHDQIAKHITANFKEHNFTRLVDAVLRAQGYTTYVSPAGPDGGADILAGSGAMGFGTARLVVEVKSGASPTDRPTVDKLMGAITKFGANEGLFVSWSGFKANVPRELAASFFKVRLWSQKEFLEALFANYDKLDEDIRAELPLKRVWTVAAQEE